MSYYNFPPEPRRRNQAGAMQCALFKGIGNAWMSNHQNIPLLPIFIKKNSMSMSVTEIS